MMLLSVVFVSLRFLLYIVCLFVCTPGREYKCGLASQVCALCVEALKAQVSQSYTKTGIHDHLPVPDATPHLLDCQCVGEVRE